MKSKAKKFWYCSHCGLKFKRTTKNQTVCNDCKFSTRTNARYWNYTKKCVVCNGEFKAMASTQKYCCQKCRVKAVLKYSSEFSYAKIRFEVFKRDDFRCRYCGRSPSDGAVLEVDHVVPRKLGGENLVDNYVTSCKECNVGKGDCLIDNRRRPRKMLVSNILDEVTPDTAES